MDESERQALVDQLAGETRALQILQENQRLALARRNRTLRLMKAAGFKLAELREHSGLAMSMLSRITKREGSGD